MILNVHKIVALLETNGVVIPKNMYLNNYTLGNDILNIEFQTVCTLGERDLISSIYINMCVRAEDVAQLLSTS
jgi:hypothetical protein